MRILNIYTTYTCPYKCRFCFNVDKVTDHTLLDISKVDKFLKKNSKLFDKIVITGGEPSTLLKSYITELIETCKKYKDEVYMSTYMLINAPTFDGVIYDVSYDLLARPRVNDAWVGLMKFDKEFELTMTLSPMMFKFQPNKVFQTLAQLKMLRKVHIKPYYKNKNNQYVIKKSDYEKYMKCVRNTQLKLKYTIDYDSFPDEFNLTPYGDLTVTKFDDNEIRYEEKISENDITKQQTNYPRSVRV